MQSDKMIELENKIISLEMLLLNDINYKEIKSKIELFINHIKEVRKHTAYKNTSCIDEFSYYAVFRLIGIIISGNVFLSELMEYSGRKTYTCITGWCASTHAEDYRQV